MRALAQGVAVLLCALQCVLPVEAAEIVNAAFRGENLGLSPYVALIQSERPAVRIELPASGGTAARSFELKGEGPGPVYRWAVLTLRNPEPGEKVLVLAAPRQGFVGSGLIWPATLGDRIVGLRSMDGAPIARLQSTGSEAWALAVPPSVTSTFAIELANGRHEALKLWQRAAFEDAESERSFLSGAFLGLATFLAFAITAIAILNPRGMFLAGVAFAWPCVAFMGLELGYLLPRLAATSEQLRALVEALMLAGLTGLLATLFDARRAIPSVGPTAIGVAGAEIGLAIYGWFEPAVASGIARMGFAAVALAGGILLGRLAWQDMPRARASVPFWAMLLLWTAGAASMLEPAPYTNAAPLFLTGGLLAALMLLGVTLGRFAAGQGLASRNALQESERRGLALAGADLIVWDWQVARGRFFVGSELDRALGFQAGTVGARSLKGWLELIHPADRAAYVAAIEAAEQRGRGTFAHEFRLRRGDGTYRWYLLRGKAIDEGRVGLRLVGTLADVTSHRRAEDRLLSDAVRDRVTGLPNRALFLDRLEREVRRATSEGDGSLYVAVVGLDRFKSLNEGLGPEIGDSLLNIAGRRLSALMGPEDTLGRLRGDQFAVIFHATKPPRDVNAFLAEMRDTLGQPISVRPREVSLTASFGVARLRSGGVDPEEILKDAEIAMHEAKRKGRATIEFYRPDMRDERSRMLSLEQDLRRAVERNEIEVVFQPIMRLASQELAGFEALMRWRRGGEVLLQPDGFIGLAEELGIIRDLGRHVLVEAVRQAGIWYRAFRPREPIYIAVNLSSAELLNAELVDEVRVLLAREDVKPEALKLEITESLVMENPELAEKILDRFKHMGVSLACDDFGTGYSALANLRRLPFDTLKVDKAFLDHDIEDERAAILLESVLMMAHDLGLSVVAEGIESEAQLNRLVELGCDYGQGFFIGAPATAKQVIEALAGLPYSTGARGGGMTAFWARFVGRREPKTTLALEEIAKRRREAPVVPAPDLKREEAPEPVESIPEPEDVELEPEEAFPEVAAEEPVPEEETAREGSEVEEVQAEPEPAEIDLSYIEVEEAPAAEAAEVAVEREEPPQDAEATGEADAAETATPEEPEQDLELVVEEPGETSEEEVSPPEAEPEPAEETASIVEIPRASASKERRHQLRRKLSRVAKRKSNR